MFPEPFKVKSAHVCRDFGTYVMLYLDSENHFYSLELPVVVGVIDGQPKRIGYEPPIIKVYDPVMHGSIKVTLQLSWHEGLELKHKLTGLLDENFSAEAKAHANDMFELLQLQGSLPDVQ